MKNDETIIKNYTFATTSKDMRNPVSINKTQENIYSMATHSADRSLEKRKRLTPNTKSKNSKYETAGIPSISNTLDEEITCYLNMPVNVTTSTTTGTLKEAVYATTNTNKQENKVTTGTNSLLKLTGNNLKTFITKQHTSLIEPTKMLVRLRSTSNRLLNVTTVPNNQDKVTRCISNDTLNSAYGIEEETVKQNSKTNGLVKFTNIPKQALEPSVPYHLPLHINIPQNTLASCNPYKIVPSTSHPKGKIVIQKSKLSRYVPSEQPILITASSMSLSNSTCGLNSIEQLATVAINHDLRSLQYQEESIENDMNVGANEDVSENNIIQDLL